ncbi:tyrosine-type recombinase/integrase [Microbacterium sp. NPDC089695]|uniref:tyrosine-type recombinase/integrase n=1 Tax=Microbacterium sp. NPDC089695 TaxID=3364198 RepID=UPI003824ECB8
MTDRSGAAIGASPLTPDSTVNELAAEFLNALPHRTGSDKAQSVSNKVRTIRKHIVGSALGGMTLRQLTVGAVKRHHAALVAQDKKATARQVVSALREILAFAAEDDLVQGNVAVEFRMKRPPTQMKYVPAVSDVQLLRDAARAYRDRPGRMGPRPTPLLLDAIDIILGTGLRIGEVLGLRWSDLNLDGPSPTLEVLGTVVEGHGIKKHWQPGPKVMKSERTFFIDDALTATLKRRRTESVGRTRYVFETNSGAPTGPHQWRVQLWKVRDWALSEESGFAVHGEMGAHALRRAVATVVADETDVVTAARLLGQRETGVTERHYARRNPEAPDVRSVLSVFADTGPVREVEL